MLRVETWGSTLGGRPAEERFDSMSATAASMSVPYSNSAMTTARLGDEVERTDLTPWTLDSVRSMGAETCSATSVVPAPGIDGDDRGDREVDVR